MVPLSPADDLTINCSTTTFTSLAITSTPLTATAILSVVSPSAVPLIVALSVLPPLTTVANPSSAKV